MTEPDVSPGRRLQHAMQNEKPLAVAGTINAYCALLAQKAGFNALYLSGAGVANASFGLPDLGLTTLENVREDTARITSITKLPLIVDADTGFGDPAATAKVLSGADAAAMQIEDQVDTKRCGHRPGKVLVPGGEMQDRIKSALRGKSNPDFMIIARTDAYTVEGLDAAIARAQQYVKAGADIIFAEALTQLDEYKTFCRSVSVPVLANITEFGKTPLYSMDELGGAGVQLVLYPLTAFRAMSAAALKVYQTLRAERSQASLIDSLQTREELYKILNYYEYEKALDDTLSSGKE
ncbi:MAG: methylisocitrate lyase [Gammaproteobacteria bacterium]|nr:methylisocitrate lyase [Gammaproteobacteria bacterium]